ncbi:BLUF domain-containing protein [Marinomonas posidonica]|uniref:BLUF domain protein n=1 Tax=Marinomonas posidonica (strain CECT 7376 / NCIMB 14433 / IVIA-Po-181) TaxID=491952 RepID=F6CVF9_MARPP|nr:BLUF domain-containing protein [Marinomonas posidonica]AEF55336.1 BLUF domain protein [Marinomonas posidonica IVIA-Po-181]
MSLVRLLYASTISETFSSNDIKQILSSAERNNAKQYVTGMLSFNRQYFLQCLEGSREHVNEIYHRIARDPRHQRIEILDYQHIAIRSFSEWHMGYLQNTQTLSELFYKYSPNDQFDPYRMSPEGAFALLLDIKMEILKAMQDS